MNIFLFVMSILIFEINLYSLGKLNYSLKPQYNTFLHFKIHIHTILAHLNNLIDCKDNTLEPNLDARLCIEIL